MKLIIAGGRYYRLTAGDLADLDHLNAAGRLITEVVSGCATGADTGGEFWAKLRHIQVTRFPAAWEDLTHPYARIKTRPDGTKYDANAGFLRNERMAEYADAVVLFPGGPGTADMYRRAKAHDLIIFDWRY